MTMVSIPSSNPADSPSPSIELLAIHADRDTFCFADPDLAVKSRGRDLFHRPSRLDWKYPV